MRLIETCTCGASIEANWTSPNSEYSYGQAREEEEGKKQLSIFRKNHKACLASNQDDDAASRLS